MKTVGLCALTVRRRYSRDRRCGSARLLQSDCEQYLKLLQLRRLSIESEYDAGQRTREWVQMGCTMKAITVYGSILIILELLLSSCGSDQVTREQARFSATREESRHADTESSAYIIQKGDQVQMAVLGYPEFSATVPVKETGAITVPFVGEVQAVGLTRDQLSKQITAKLSDYVKNSVFLNITVTTGQKVVVLGSVVTQGSYSITTPVSLFQVLALAGGASGEADLRRVKIFHSPETSNPQEVDLTNYVANNVPGAEVTKEAVPQVRPGDMVYVPKEENVVRDFAGLLRDVLALFYMFALVR